MARKKVPQIPDSALERLPAVAQYRMAQHGAEIKIGRAEQSLPNTVILPEVRSEKWGGEAWLKVSHADIAHIKASDRAKEFINSKGGKGVEIPVGAKGRKHRIQEGSLEWDIVYESSSALPENLVEVFDIEQPESGMSWWYQPELTAEVIANGDERPDNVVGSYAIYWNKSGRYLDSNGSELVNYGTGKYAHLYRPVLIDANGDEEWAEQYFNAETSQLEITFPSEWLATAVYPITLDPVFGYGDEGGSLKSIFATRTYAWQIDSPASDGVVDKLTFFTNYLSSSDAATGGLYTWGSDPDDLLTNGATPEFASTIGESSSVIQVDAPYTNKPSVTSSGSYCAAICTDGSGIICYLAYDSISGYYGKAAGDTYTSGTLIDPYPTTYVAEYSNYKASIYATYTESGGGTTHEGSLALATACTLSNTPAATYEAAISYAATGGISEAGAADLQASLSLAAQIAQTPSAGATILMTVALTGAAGLSSSTVATLAASISLPTTADMLANYGNIVTAALALEAVGAFTADMQAEYQAALNLISQAGASSTGAATISAQVLFDLQAALAAAFEANAYDVSTSFVCSAALAVDNYAELAAALTFATGTVIDATVLQDVFASVSLQTLAALAATYPGDLVTALKVLAIFRAKDPGATFTAKDPTATFN